jgi:hypothetical protein
MVRVMKLSKMRWTGRVARAVEESRYTDYATDRTKRGSIPVDLCSPKRPDLPSLVFNGVLSSKVKRPEREAAQLLCLPYISS